MPDASGLVTIVGTGVIVRDFGCGGTDLGVAGLCGSTTDKYPRPGIIGGLSWLMLEETDDRLLDSFRLSRIACKAGFSPVSIMGQYYSKRKALPQLNIPIAGLQALYNIPGGQDCSNVDMSINTVMPGFGAEAEVIKCVTLA